MLSYPVQAQRVDSRARDFFGEWTIKNIDRWFAFVKQLGTGIKRMKDFTGCDRTRAWTNVALSEDQIDARASFGANAYQRHDTCVDIEFLPGCVIGGALVGNVSSTMVMDLREIWHDLRC